MDNFFEISLDFWFYLADIDNAMEREMKKSRKMGPFYTVVEMADRIGRSEQWVRDNAKSLPGARETFPGSGRYWFLRADVEAFYFGNRP